MKVEDINNSIIVKFAGNPQLSTALSFLIIIVSKTLQYLYLNKYLKEHEIRDILS